MSVLLIIISDFKLEKKVSLSLFLNTKTNVDTNLKPFNGVNNSISLLLIADSVSLNCSSGLKDFKKTCARFVIFILFSFKKCSLFLYHYVKGS